VPPEDDGLQLGTDGDAPVGLPVKALLRHVMALGSSGSGKTVLCKILVEEVARRGIPVICIDPQGDLASLAGGVLEDPEARGLEAGWAEAFRDRVEVEVFTPGAEIGVPLCADPIDPHLVELEGHARVSALTRTASTVVGVLGYDLDSDDGAGLAAVVDQALTALCEGGATPSLAALTEHLAAEEAPERYGRFLDARKIRAASQRLARLGVGARRALFHDGVPIDVDLLLGRGRAAPGAGRTRISVVYLNSLHAQEDKEFIVATLVDRLYAWMLAHPSEAPQALFYIDEVAPFVPPVRKPSCKEGLSLLFKQARKYGVCCLMATQNPGDVDYKAMAQFGTWALGRLTTKQDLRKVKPTVDALAPDDADAILGALPAMATGSFTLLSPDVFDAPQPLTARWLLTPHETWDDDRVEAYAAKRRAAFEALIAKPAPAAASPPPAPAPVTGVPSATRSTPRLVLDALARLGASTVAQLAADLPASESTVRAALSRQIELGAVARFANPGERSGRYYRTDAGLRPELGLFDPILAVKAHLAGADIQAVAEAFARQKVLGLLGDRETVHAIGRHHRLLLRVEFEETVAPPWYQRLLGADEDERLGSLYLHPHSLAILLFTNEHGISFEEVPQAPASAIRGFDGVVTMEACRPADLDLVDRDFIERRTDAEVRARFEGSFEATAVAIVPVVMPLYELLFENERGGLRRLVVDGLIGAPVRWPGPAGDDEEDAAEGEG
jgi:hypothetical protein